MIATLLFGGLLMSSTLLDEPLKTIDGKATTLAKVKGKATLIVNTASQCGYTGQYDGLEKLYEKYKAQGLEVLGFPSNDFGAQEPGSEAQIKEFCEVKYKIKFPMFAKVHAKGPEQASLYKKLTEQKGGEVKWNFTKFLLDDKGTVIARFEPGVEPLSPELTKAVEAALK